AHALVVVVRIDAIVDLFRVEQPHEREPARLGPRIDVLDEVVHQRMRARSLSRPDEEVDLVAADGDGNLDADQAADAVAPGARGIDDDRRLDLAVGGADARHPAVAGRDPEHLCPLQGAHAALARRPGEPLPGLAWVSVPG